MDEDESSNFSSSEPEESGSEAEDVVSRRKMQKVRRHEDRKLRAEIDKQWKNMQTEQPASSSQSNSSSSDSASELEENEAAIAPPSAKAPHFLVLLELMLPLETVGECIARLGKIRDRIPDEKQRAAAALSLERVMTAAQELHDVDINATPREVLLPQAFKALRKRLPKCYAFVWSSTPITWESVPREKWQGPFEPAKMESWKNFFAQRPAYCWNINAMPREQGVLANTVEHF